MVPNPPFDPDERAEALIITLLRKLAPGSTLVQLARIPLDHYQLTVALPGEVGKTLVVAAHLVHRATTNTAARQALRAYLRSELLYQRAQQARHLASEARAMLIPTRFCPVCEQPIRPGQRFVVRGAEFRHAECRPP